MLQSFPELSLNTFLSKHTLRLRVRRRLAILLILIVAAATLVFVGFASRKASSDTGVLPVKSQEKGATPVAVNITATLADDITLANKKNPGDTITYTAVVSNSGGTDASGVAYNDTLDANTTQTGVVTISPLAINESYQSIGNMTLTSANIAVDCTTNALRSVTCNDTLHGASLTGFGNAAGTANGTAPGGTVTTTNNGSVVLNADGTFVYNPAAGFEGSDSFFYTLTNSTVTPNLTDTAQVTITLGGVNGIVWFIDSSATACITLAGNCGRQSNRFSSLSAFSGLNN